MQIIYCERCSRRIAQAEFESGRAGRIGETPLCAACLAKLPPEQRSLLEKADTRTDHPSVRPAGPHRRSTTRAPAEGRKPGLPTAFIALFAVIGGLVGVAVVLLLFGGGDETQPPAARTTTNRADPTRPPPAPPAPDFAVPQDEPTAPPTDHAAHTGPAATLTDDAKELEAVRALNDEKLTRYGEMHTRLTKLVEGTGDARDDARTLLDDIDRRYAAAAEAAFSSARARAAEFAYVGRLAEARAVLNAVGASYAAGPWLEERGRSLIREETERLDAHRTEAIDEALSRARRELEAGNLGEARAAIGDTGTWPADRRAKAMKLLAEITSRRPKAPAQSVSTRSPATRAPAPPPTKRPTEDFPEQMPKDVLKGIAGYWPLDEGRGTVSAAKYGKGTATLRKGAGWGVGVLGGALSFDGKDDFALLPNTPAWNFNGKSFTISLWADNAKGHHLIAKGKALWQGWSLSDLRFGAADTTHPVAEFRFGGTTPTGWCHIVVTFDARTGTLKGYLNAAPRQTVTTGETIGGMKNVNESSAPTLGARYAGVHGNFYEGRIDEVRVYARALADGEVSDLYWRTRMLARNARVKATEKKLGLIGGASAGARKTAKLVTAGLGEGYALARSAGVAGKNVLAARLAASVERWAKRESPEAVVVALDAADVLRGAQPEDLRRDIAFAVDKLLALGIEVVVFTAPFAKPARESAQMLLARYNQVLIDVATSRGVPLVDAYLMMNTDAATTKLYFSRGSSLTAAGTELLANEIVRAYRTVERSRLGRAVTVPATTVASRPRDRDRGEARATDEGVTEPDAPPPSDADLAVNGGFEEMNTHTKFASNWMQQRFGSGRGQYSVRVTRANPHDGDRSVELRSLAPNIQPGIQTTLTLAKGTYEVTYWACMDGDRPAMLYGSLAGKNLTPQALGDEYKKLTATVTVGEATRDGVLKLWIAVPSVRVWIDNVSVRRVR